jgi:hypothetical protein
MIRCGCTGTRTVLPASSLTSRVAIVSRDFVSESRGEQATANRHATIARYEKIRLVVVVSGNKNPVAFPCFEQKRRNDDG